MPDAASSPPPPPPPPPPPAGSSEKDNKGLLAKIPLLPAVISSIGVAGVLTGVGYVVQNARDSLLGINLVTSHTTADYVALGGEFMLDAITVTWLHWIIALSGVVAIVGIGVVTAIVLNRPKTVLWQRVFWTLGFVALTLFYILKSRWLDLPYVRMTDLLEKPPVCETASVRQAREHDIWERFLCSRNDATLHKLIGEKIQIDCSEVPGNLMLLDRADLKTGSLRRTANSLKGKIHSKFSIEQEFTFNLFGAALITYLALILCFSPVMRTVSLLTATLLRIVLLTMVIVDAITLPVVYGKVILNTRFPSGRIIYEGIAAKKDDPTTLQATPRNSACLVLSSDDKFVTFYDIENNIFVQVKRDKVYSIQANETADLIATRINYYLQSSPCGGSS
jgi:hypothetical protein